MYSNRLYIIIAVVLYSTAFYSKDGMVALKSLLVSLEF